MSYDPINKVVKQNDGRIIYDNGFGGLSTIEPNNSKRAQLDQARKEINQDDKKLHGW